MCFVLTTRFPENFLKYKFVDEQKDYNRHLKSAFKKIKNYLNKYIEEFSEEHQHKSLIERRDEVLPAIFIHLRGG